MHRKLAVSVIIVSGIMLLAWSGTAFSGSDNDTGAPFWGFRSALGRTLAPADTGEVELPMPHDADGPTPQNENTGVSLSLPDNINYEVEYDPITGNYMVVQRIGEGIDYRRGTSMSLEEYLAFDLDQSLSEFWEEKQEEEDEESREWAPKLKVGGEGFAHIFGSNEIEIRPQGSAEITFGVNVSKQDNPRIPERQRTISTFDFNQRIQLNVVGKIGTKLQLNTNYNTEAAFDFQNQMKLEYTGDEDEIIKKIEAGNVSLPLKGTLIQGSQSLFGLKVETQFGRLRNTTVFSQAKGERKEIEVAGGAQTQTFEITADNYESNRHYFLSQYFRDNYDQAMASLPVVGSGVNITRIEVWVVNNQANTQDVRNVIAFTDLGEHPDYISSDMPVGLLVDGPQTSVIPQRYPYNFGNDIFQDMIGNANVMGFSNANQAISQMGMGYQQGIHYERIGNARKLSPSEYTYNSRLGFISLRQALNNAEVLAVAYEYTLGGETYQVGTLSQDGFTAPDALILKMLKSSITLVNGPDGETSPLWDLMMKNVYNLGAFQVSRENFRLDIWYNNPATGVDMNYIPRPPLEGKMLLQVLNMDKLDYNNQPYPDGTFDFVDNAATQGGLIQSQNGRIYLPVVEPFGGHLSNVIRSGLANQAEADALINQIVFQPLYDSTKTAAQQIPALNRFKLKGQYQSASGAEISLNSINVPQGSVSVTAGGVRLIENQDYTVDYNLGRVRIINEGILNAGTPIKISLESNSLFNIQTKTMLGSRFDYTISDNFGIGATVLNLRERPLTQKVNIGNEPVNNTILGLDVNYRTESGFLTRMVDALPLIETKQKSSIDFSAEGAYLFPGHSRAVGKDGNAYLDDFEGSQSVIDIRSINQWFLASTPKLQNDLFPEGQFEDSLVYNYNRAKTSWYTIDPLFFREGAPQGIDVEVRSDHRMREVLESEVFPNRQLPAGTPPNTPTLDISFYPSDRGPYNYDPTGGSGASAGLNPDGTLADPASRWGGIQRALTTTDFETTNVEFIQFWLMDPFNQDSENINGGDLYFNLGNVSEDILNDSHLTFENGFPSQNQPLPILESVWGFYPDPSTFNVVNAFDATSGNYSLQDIGLDGLNSTSEQSFFGDYLGELQGFLSPEALTTFESDLSADDYEYFRREGSINTIDRYRNYNGYEGNSNTESVGGISISATTVPNTEDINQDLTLGTIESYYQYKVSLRPGDLGVDDIGTNFIADRLDQVVQTANGETRNIAWYQFKIPIREYEKRLGGIADFRSIRFIRVYMKGFSEPVTLRFARLELVRGEWRKYLESLETPGELEPEDPEPTSFNLSAVNIEENGNRQPIPYVIPPGIERQIDVGTANLRNLNEQSLQLAVCNLADGDARGAYRNVNFDMRMYEKLKMFVHAEQLDPDEALNNNDITCFVRLGSDFVDNYYEYEIPLTLTPFGTSDPNAIWPEANNIEIEFKKLQNLKTTRPTGYPLLQEFIQADGEARIKIKGNPNLANVVTVMIGVRNPKQDNNPYAPDDGLPKCAIVWANELRLTDFNQEGGWAAVARVNATLADFANVAFAANISKPGWGTLEQRVQERQQETIKGFDASSTLQLGKFFPEDAGVTLPMYVGYSEAVRNPRFDPLAPDIEFDDISRNLSREERRERQKKTENFTRRKSINFSNVTINPKGGGNKGDKGGGKGQGKQEEGKGAEGGGKEGKQKEDKPKLYDISNFSLSYSYNEIYQRDVNTEFNSQKNYTGGLNYNFNNKPKEIKPFEKIGFVKDAKALKFVKDFNFYPGIKQLSFRTQMDRMYNTMRIRDNSQELFGVDADVIIPTQVMKTWNWTRGYTVRYDLTKSIRLSYDANNMAFVGEPQGVINKDDRDGYQAYKDSVWANIQNFGVTTGYNHNVSASYKLPLDKFPMLDFLSSDISYAGTYRWDRAPFSQDTLGNTIQNSRNIQLNAQANFQTLYNKVPLLKEINSPKKEQSDKGKKPSNENVDGFGKEIEKDKKDKIQINPLHEFLRLLMMVQNVSGTYSKTEGILLPGYGRNTRVAGMDPNFEAPGLGFILGQQNTDVFGNEVGNYALQAGSNGWLVQQQFLNNQYTETFNETINVRAKLEPIKYLTLELTANQTETRSLSSFFRWDDEDQVYVFDSPVETGNYSASIVTWPTAFVKDRQDFSSETFDFFLDNRRLVSQRLNEEFHNYPIDSIRPNGYYAGWGPTSQDVVIPTFIASYTNQDISNVPLDPFMTKMKPNWKITYDGLSKIPSIKKRFKQFSITHNYRSSFNTSFTTNFNHEADANGNPIARDQGDFQNYIPQKQINSISISEQLSPLIGFDMTLKVKNKNKKDIDPQIRVEWSKDRNVTLGLSNYQITESKNNALIFGVGYTIPEVPNPFMNRRRGSKLAMKMLENSPLNLRADLTIRDNSTIIRKMEERQNQVTAGQRIISLKMSADLSVSDKLTLRFFYDHQLTRPKISTSFPTANINSGLALRFQLTQ